MGQKDGKTAKQLHKQYNEMAMQITKANREKEKAIRRITRRVETRKVRREGRQHVEGTAVMNSGTTSTVIQPNDNKYVIETNLPSNEFFMVATGEQARAGNQAKL